MFKVRRVDYYPNDLLVVWKDLIIVNPSQLIVKVSTWSTSIFPRSIEKYCENGSVTSKKLKEKPDIYLPSLQKLNVGGNV